MTRNNLRRLFLLASTGFILAACGTDTAEDPSETDTEITQDDETSGAEDAVGEITFTVDIVVDGEAAADLSQEITTEEGTYLLDAMHESYDVEESEEFVSSIEGYEQEEDEGIFWTYYINDEMASVGAAEYELEEGDQVEWRLEGFE